MPPVAPSTLLDHIASGRLEPVYVLRGEDEAEKDHLVSQLVATLEEDLRPFNLLVMSAVDATNMDARSRVADEVLGTARTLPMMAPRRLVILREAERVLFPKKRGGSEEDEEDGGGAPVGRGKASAVDEDAFEAYVQNPEPMTTLVFVCGAWDDRRRVAKLLDARSAIVTCGSPETEADAIRWVLRQGQASGATIEPAAARELVARTGLEITSLRHALERVSLYALGESAVTANQVRDVLPPSADAIGQFAIADMIREGRAADALRELGLLLDAGAAPLMVFGSMRWAVEQRFPPGRLAAAFDALLEADLALKRSVGDARTRLEVLVVELCGAGTPAVKPRR